MRISWENFLGMEFRDVPMPTISCAVLVSHLATGIFTSMVSGIPLSLSLYCFSITAFMGTSLVVGYTWILENLSTNPKYSNP